MALKIRAITPSDIALVRELHERYYRQFEFPPFANALNGFIIEDDKTGFVMAGCVEKVAEAMLVTNKAQSEIKIGKALVEAQQCVAFTCKSFGIRDVYAFVDNDAYARHLVQHGFQDNKTRALKLRIP